MLKTRLLILALACAVPASAIHGQETEKPQPEEDRGRVFARLVEPLAIRGSVLVIPLVIEPGPALSDVDANLVLEDGQVLNGHICTLRFDGQGACDEWLLQEQRVHLEPISLDEIVREGPAIECLLVCDMPVEIDGSIEFMGGRLNPKWVGPLSRPTRSDSGTMEAAQQERRDDMTAADHFRTVLAARDRGEQEPLPPGNLQTMLLARHRSDLWLWGLSRVEQASPGVAAELRERLTARCLDLDLPSGGPIPCWISSPEDLQVLLGLITDPAREPGECMNAAYSWLLARSPLLSWPVESDAKQISIRLANSTIAPVVTRMTWVENDQVPIAVEVPANSIKTISLQRPDRPPTLVSSSTEGIKVDRLLIECNGVREHLDFVMEPYIVTPPGFNFGAFVAPLQLEDVETGSRVPIPQERLTTGQLRLRSGRWELYFECHTPGELGDTGPDRLRIFLGSPDDPSNVIQVDRDGTLTHVLGIQPASDPFEVSCTGFQDHWRCRIVLPRSWMPVAQGRIGPGTLQLGLMRIEPDGRWQTAGYARAPWQAIPSTFDLDIDQWRTIREESISSGRRLGTSGRRGLLPVYSTHD